MKMSESVIELSVALSKFQEKVEQPAKTANNPFFKSSYVPLENVISAVKKTCTRSRIILYTNSVD